MEMTSMVDPNVIQTLDNDWVEEFLEDDSEDLYEESLYDDTSGIEIEIEYTTDY